MKNDILTLIQTSQDRKKELSRFVDSLNRQKGIDFSKIQLIFVDQGDNKSIFDRLNPSIDFVYIKTERCSLSHARNLALANVFGEYVCFPDDDCWYEKDVLEKVLKVLEVGSYQGVCGIGKDENGILTSSFPKKQISITPINIQAAISYTMFFKYSPRIFFDENMGVGSPYNIGSGEESDYMLNLIRYENYKVLYDPDIVIHHPTGQIYEKRFLLNKAYSYARGFGYLMHKHEMPFIYKCKQIIRPIGGMLIYALCMDFFKVKKSFYNLKGRLEGLFFRL